MIDGRRFEVMELGKEESYSFRNELIDWEHYEMNLSEMIWQPIWLLQDEKNEVKESGLKGRREMKGCAIERCRGREAGNEEIY